MSSSNSPCAACKIQRRKCTQDCVFAPYFPPDQPQKFANVHKVFGASNVSKLLQELSAEHREDAVNSLAYEAEARLRDPVYGCVGLISILQQRLKEVQSDLLNAKKELATYIGPQAMSPIFQTQVYMSQGNNPSSSSGYPYNAASAMMGFQQGPPRGGQLVIREPQAQQQAQPQVFDAQQLAAAVAAREHQQELLMRLALEQKMAMYQQPQQQQPPPQYRLEPVPQNLARFTSSAGYDPRIGPPDESGFNQMRTATTEEPTLVLGSGFDNTTYQIQPQQSEHDHSHHHQLQEQHNDHSHQQLSQEHHHSNEQIHQEQFFDLDSTPQQPFLQLGTQPRLRHKLEGGEEDKRIGPPF